MTARSFRLAACVCVALAALGAVPLPVTATVDTWSPVGNSGNTPAITDVTASVNAMLVTDDGVLLGGNFSNPGGAGTGDSFALWNGAAFSGIGSNGSSNGYFDSIGDTVRAIAKQGDDIYVGGSFTNNSGNANADNIVMWDDSANAWVALDSGLNAAVRSIVVDGTNVYVGGDFTDADGIPEADYVAKWNGSSWSALGSNGNPSNGALGGHVNSLVMKNGSLFAGGLFTEADGVATADYVAKWTGTSWTNLGANGNNGVLTGEVHTLLVDGSKLLVGGNFTNANSNSDMDYVAKWTNNTWSDFNTDGVITNAVYALAVDGGDMYAGGVFTQSGGPRDRIAKWDGTSWSNLDDNGGNGAVANNSVLALALWDRDLFVAGSFTDVMGETESDYLVSWGLLPEFKPDARIRNGLAGGWTGNNIYNTTGNNQQKTQTGGANALKHYQVSLQNDSPTESDVFTIQTANGSTNRFTITYFNGASDITGDLTGGGYVTPAPLAPGAQLIIDIEVQYNNAPANASVTRKLTITSNGNNAKKDAVKFVAQR
jgi:hypothetical protein